jgi:hypothetical protein
VADLDRSMLLFDAPQELRQDHFESVDARLPREGEEGT